MTNVLTLVACLLLGTAHAMHADVMSIGGGQVQLLVNGTTVRVLRVGTRSPEGVKLVSISGDRATFEASGITYNARLGGSIDTTLILQADRRGQFYTSITVNGRSVRAVVDTGATSVAFNQTDAAKLGLNYKGGQVGKATTASGVITVYRIVLPQLQIGPLILRNVVAGVTESPSYPDVVLLGTSALKNLNVVSQGGTLSLSLMR